MKEIQFDKDGFDRSYEEFDSDTKVLYGDTSCFVAGCNPDLGITLIGKDTDPPVYILCLHGPLSQRYKILGFSGPHPQHYKHTFNILVNFIKAGKIPEIALKGQVSNNKPTAESCPFAQ